MKILFKRIGLSIKILIVAFLLWSVTSTTVEHTIVDSKKNAFISKGVYQEDMSSDTVKYYRVAKEDWMDDKEAFTEYNGNIYWGAPGDIMLTMESAFPGVPFVDFFINTFIGGHASLCAYEYSDERNKIKLSDSVETSGLSVDPVGNMVYNNNRAFWKNNRYKKEVFVLRVNCNEETRKEAFNYAVSTFYDSYNYSFIFNTQTSSYCSDVVSKAYKRAGVELNPDGVATTVIDLAASKNTYIALYKTYDDKGITYIYYLDKLEPHTR